jgi:AraC-like DNA-binding protein
VVSGLQALGHDVDAILTAVGIDQALLTDAEARVPHESAMRLWQVAIERSGDDALGLHVAEAAAIESFDVHAYAVFASATLREGFRRACRYQRLIHETTELSLTNASGGARLRHSLPGGFAVPRPSAEFLLTAYVRLGRVATGADWTPLEVRFANSKPPDIAEHRRFFGGTPSFEAGENSICIDDDVLDRPCPQANRGLLKVLDRHASELLARAPNAATLSARLRAHLVNVLSDGAPSVEQVAERFKMSARTLSRGLRAEGTSFKEVLDQLRLERASEMLRQRTLSIAEIAFLLGFADVSAFYRAFKRWTDKTPIEFLQS